MSGPTRGLRASTGRDAPRYDVPMAGRTFAVGDIHGEIAPLMELLARLPKLTAAELPAVRVHESR